MPLFLILFFSNQALLFANLIQNCKFQGFSKLNSESILRGHYKDVASQSNGATITSARFNIFVGTPYSVSPLKHQLYYVSNTQGHMYTYSSIDVQFVQIYEINKIILWLYDIDGRKQNLKIIAIDQNNHEKQLFQGQNAIGIQKITFQDQMVSMLKFMNQPGGTDGDLVIIKISAFYEKKSLI